MTKTAIAAIIITPNNTSTELRPDRKLPGEADGETRLGRGVGEPKVGDGEGEGATGVGVGLPR